MGGEARIGAQLVAAGGLDILEIVGLRTAFDAIFTRALRETPPEGRYFFKQA